MNNAAEKYRQRILSSNLMRRTGRLLEYNGLVVEANGPDVSLGELCDISTHRRQPVAAEVVGFREGRVLLMPYGNIHGISFESEIVARGKSLGIPVGNGLLGRVIDAFCNPLDDRGTVHVTGEYPLYREPINPLARSPIDEVLETGVRAVDSLLTLGKGQRIGIFAGSGVGKSTLLGMIARNVKADVAVIALVGERGREVWDFISGALGPAGLARSVVVVATADQPALVRTHAVHAATAIAEYFRDQNKNVLLIMDSITRFAMAHREIGLATGEPPTSRGYPPSTLSILPQVLERAGNLTGRGSITAIYSVLVEGDDMNEPVADHMRALIDGHIVLSRTLASSGHYPAIEITQSVSRLLTSLLSKQDLDCARQVVRLMASYETSRDLIEMGAYRAGTNPELDSAVARMSKIKEFLNQPASDVTTFPESMRRLQAILDDTAGAPTA